MQIHQDIQALKQEWFAVTTQWGACNTHQIEIFNHLVACYNASNRHYHGISHIQHMLRLSNELQHNIRHKQAFYLAIWFHDAIQQSGKDSEALSAELAKQQLRRLNAPEAVIKRVTTLILATQTHEEQENTDTALFVDIDLAILAANREPYQQYAQGCKKEYSIPNFLYRRGRKRFLAQLLNRNFIFSSQVFRDSKESLARENIKWELSIL